MGFGGFLKKLAGAASFVPGPWQPFAAGASALWNAKDALSGGGGGLRPPMVPGTTGPGGVIMPAIYSLMSERGGGGGGGGGRLQRILDAVRGGANALGLGRPGGLDAKHLLMGIPAALGVKAAMGSSKRRDELLQEALARNRADYESGAPVRDAARTALLERLQGAGLQAPDLGGLRDNTNPFRRHFSASLPPMGQLSPPLRPPPGGETTTTPSGQTTPGYRDVTPKAKKKRAGGGGGTFERGGPRPPKGSRESQRMGLY